jgi:hypothetical protein
MGELCFHSYICCILLYHHVFKVSSFAGLVLPFDLRRFDSLSHWNFDYFCILFVMLLCDFTRILFIMPYVLAHNGFITRFPFLWLDSIFFHLVKSFFPPALYEMLLKAIRQLEITFFWPENMVFF